MWMVIMWHDLLVFELSIFQNSLISKNIITTVYRIWTYDSIMCGYFCTGFIDFMMKGKSFLDYTNLFSLYEYGKNERIMVKYFQQL